MQQVIFLKHAFFFFPKRFKLALCCHNAVGTIKVKTVQQAAEVVLHIRFKSKQLICCLIKNNHRTGINIPLSLRTCFFGNAMACCNTFVELCRMPDKSQPLRHKLIGQL